jgi:hypothetical protein
MVEYAGADVVHARAWSGQSLADCQLRAED